MGMPWDRLSVFSSPQRCPSEQQFKEPLSQREHWRHRLVGETGASGPLPPPQPHCSFPGPASRTGGAPRGRQPCFLSGLTFLVGQGTSGKGTEGLRG